MYNEIKRSLGFYLNRLSMILLCDIYEGMSENISLLDVIVWAVQIYFVYWEEVTRYIFIMNPSKAQKKRTIFFGYKNEQSSGFL